MKILRISKLQNQNVYMLRITQLPDDILFSIVEFINPICSQERTNVLCELIVPVLPFLVKYFTNKNKCDENDHTYLDKTLCVHTIPRLDYDFTLHKHYFYTILKKLIVDLTHKNALTMRKIKNKRKIQYEECERSTYTYHFPENTTLQEDHPFVKFVVQYILPCTMYTFSHMCCNGNGLFAVGI